MFLLAFLMPAVPCANATVPITLPTSTVPDTCEEEFWDMMKSRADMEANREITQNQNLIAKPDSVLMLTCFDSVLDVLGGYADDNFPSNPGDSPGKNSLDNSESVGGIFTDLMVIFIRDTLGDTDPHLTGGHLPTGNFGGVKGGQLIHLLELLILDNLVEGVSSISNTWDNTLYGLCDGKEFYIDHNNFDGVLMGGRSTSNVQMRDELSTSFSVCSLMNNIWNQARCSNFQQDGIGLARDNDGFHTFEDYVNTEIVGGDYRVFPSMCTKGTQSDSDIVASLACQAFKRGTPPLPTGVSGWASFIANLTASGARPWTMITTDPVYWQNLQAATTLAPGAPGAADLYVHRLEMFRSANAAECSAIQPVRTGLIARRTDGTEYYDAICPAAGCWFNPPTSLAGTGTCQY